MAPTCATLCALMGAVVSLIVFGFTAHLTGKYSPIYEPVECVQTNRSFDLITNATGAFIETLTHMSCRNPNPYEMKFGLAGPGRVFVPPDLTIGRTEATPATLPARGSGVMIGVAHVFVPANKLSALVKGPVKVMRLDPVEITVVISELGISIPFYKTVQPSGCGFEVIVGYDQETKTMKTTTGPDLCSSLMEGDGMDRLIENIPPATDEKIIPFKLVLPDHRMAYVRLLRDAPMYTVMIVTGVLVLALSGLTAWCLRSVQHVGRVTSLKGYADTTPYTTESESSPNFRHAPLVVPTPPV